MRDSSIRFDGGRCEARGRDEFGACAIGCLSMCAEPDDCCPCECDSEVRIEAGEYWRGSSTEETGRDDDEARHRVVITRPFAMDRTEVTQRQWRDLMGSRPASEAGCDECPVETVNFYESLHYANARSAEDGLESCYVLDGCFGDIGTGCPDDGRVWRRCTGPTCARVELTSLDCSGWRLPTEAEWEYAARAGSDSPFPGGDGVERANVYGWCGDAGGRSHPVGEKPTNPWGLLDIFGNVYEWTWDRYAAYDTSREPLTDPINLRGDGAVIRGGSFAFGDNYCRAANRGAREMNSRENVLGFRLVRTLDR